MQRVAVCVLMLLTARSAAAQPAAQPADEGVVVSDDATDDTSASDDDAEAIEVHSANEEREAAGQSTNMSREEVRRLPGAFGDPFRAIESMPGVTPIATGLPFFFVRGAPPGNVGYFLDGIRVPILFHVGLGPAVIHPALIDNVELYPGAYPARYGRYAGGIVTAETTEPQPEWHGEGNIRLFDAGALVEGGLFDDELVVMLGGRYSYTGLILSLVSPDVELSYWDYQARVAWNVSPRHRFSVFAFGAADRLAGEEGDGSTNVILDTSFHRIDLRYDQRLRDGGGLRVAGTLGFDENEFGDSATTLGRSFGLRGELNVPVSRRWTLRTGADAIVEMFEVDGSDSFTDLFPTRVDVSAGVRGDAVYRFAPRGTVTPGLRVDYYGSGSEKEVAIEPRLALEVPLTDESRLLPAVGVAHQAPSFLPVAGFRLPGLEQGIQRSIQHSMGVELDLPQALTLRMTAFHNVFLSLLDPFGIDFGEGQDGGGDDDVVDLAELLGDATGAGYGLEIHLRRRLSKRIGGFLSYTLSRAERCLDRACGPSSFDRTHVLSAAIALDFGAGWLGGTKHAFYSGRPATGDDSIRLPPFYRLDVRLEKQWFVAERVRISFVAEWLNATLHSEVTDLDCRQGQPCGRTTIGPVTIPSLGVEAAF